MSTGLTGVRVVAALRYLDRAQRHAGEDQTSRRGELTPQLATWELDREFRRLGQAALDLLSAGMNLTAHLQDVGERWVVGGLISSGHRVGSAQESFGLAHDHGVDPGASERPARAAQHHAIDARRPGPPIGQKARDPALSLDLLAVRCAVPDLDRAEVRSIGARVADAEHQGQLARLPGRHERLQGLVQAEMRVELQDLVARQGEPGPGLSIGRILVGHDGVQGVVAAVQLEQDQHLVAASCGTECGAGAEPWRRGEAKAGGQELSPADALGLWSS